MLLATVVIDPPSIAALAALFVFFMARQIAAGSPMRRSVLIGAFIGLWFSLSFGMHAFKYPAWMLCYLVDPRSLPTIAWYPFFVAALVASGALGAWGAHKLIAQGSRKNAFLLALGFGALWLALFAVTLKRYLVIGTFDEYLAGTAKKLSEQPDVMRDFNIVTVITASAPLLLLASILMKERKLPSAPPAPAGT